jgi:hypothetical protein
MTDAAGAATPVGATGGTTTGVVVVAGGAAPRASAAHPRVTDGAPATIGTTIVGAATATDATGATTSAVRGPASAWLPA